MNRTETSAGWTAADRSTSPNPVAEWRRGRLLAAGFAPDLAARLAAECGIDLHAILELIDRDCPPELAARILAPLDNDRWPC